MTLDAQLSASVGEDGFELSATFTGLEGVLGAVDVPGANFDVAAIGSATATLDGVDVGGITATLGGVLERVAAAAGFGDLADLLGPLQAAVELAEQLATADIASAIGSLDGASPPDGLSGLAALDHRLQVVTAVGADPSVRALLDLGRELVPADLPIAADVSATVDMLDGVRKAIELVGGLMGVESSTRELLRMAELGTTMLAPAELSSATARLRGLATTDLSGLLAGIDPHDVGLVDLVAPPIIAHLADLRLATDALVRAMAFGEATLARADLAAVVGRLEQATALLDEAGLPTVRALAEQLRTWLQPVLDIELPDPAASLDGFVSDVRNQLSALLSPIGALDPAALAAPVTGALREATGVLAAIGRAAQEVTAAISSALGTVGDLIGQIDLAPITEAIERVLGPIGEALDAVTSVVGSAQGGIEIASDAVVAAMTTVRDALGAAKDAIDAAFGRLDDVIVTLGLPQLQETLEAALAPIAAAIGSVQLRPYFDTAEDVIDTTASVLDAVPLSLLPDDALQELADAVEPVRSIDFQRDVADVLKAELQAIRDSIDSEVLVRVEEAFTAVKQFLADLDPTVPLQELEAQVFDPMIEGLRSIDPEVVLGPIEEALTTVRDAVADLDLTAALQPIEDALDEVASAIAEFDPAVFLAPIEAQVDALRTTIVDTVRLDEWAGWLDDAERIVGDLLHRVEPRDLLVALDGSFDAVLAELAGEPTGESVLGTMLTGLLESAGVGIRPDAFAAVAGWLGGQPAASVVQGRLETAAGALEAMLAAVTEVDLMALITQLEPNHRKLRVALEAHPEGSPLRARLEAEVVLASPQDMLAPVLASRDVYESALADAAARLRSLAGSARSELDAIALGMRDALSPLQAVVDRFRGLLARFGLDPQGKTPRQVAAELAATFRPSAFLDPLVATIEALRDRIEALIVEGLLGPLRGAATELEGAVAAIDISFVRTELEAIFDQVAGLVDGVRPTTVLAPLLGEAEALRAAVLAFDPLGPVRDAVDALTAAIDDVDQNFRPTLLFAPLVDIHAAIVAAVDGVDLVRLLEPILAGVDAVQAQLEDGLDSTAAALSRLQDALPDGSGSGASASVSVSVGVG